MPAASKIASGFVTNPLSQARFKYNGKLAEYLLEGDDEFIYKTCYPLSHVDIKGAYSQEFMNGIRRLDQGRAVSERHLSNDYDMLNKLLLLDVHTILPDSYLVKVDRMTMAHGIEARVPLIDYKLVEFAFTVPPELKLHGKNEKYLFKKAMKDVLPERTVARKKQGFGVPTDQWAEELKDVFEPLLLSKSLENRGYFNKEFIQRTTGYLHDIDPYQTRVAWNLATLEIWHRIFIDGDGKIDNVLSGWD